MAQFYTIKCPECGEVFGVVKGVYMSYDFTKPIPKELLDETPFNCPKCNHEMCVLDENNRDNVLEVIFGD